MNCGGGSIGPATNFCCHGQKRDYLSRDSQRARGATKNGGCDDGQGSLFVWDCTEWITQPAYKLSPVPIYYLRKCSSQNDIFEQQNMLSFVA